MDITVDRNAFGRQIDSFEADLDVAGSTDGPLHAVFIRAPVIREPGPAASRCWRSSRTGASSPAARGALLATSFHPELTQDTRLHAAFVALVRGVAWRTGRMPSGATACTSPHAHAPDATSSRSSPSTTRCTRTTRSRASAWRGRRAARAPLGAAIEQWLGLGRRIVDRRRRRPDRGIATARELASRRAWLIDTLIDAGDGTPDGTSCWGGLLRQAADAATEERGATRCCCALRVDSPALRAAHARGFKQVLAERRGGRAARLGERRDAPSCTVRCGRRAAPPTTCALPDLQPRAAARRARGASA